MAMFVILSVMIFVAALNIVTTISRTVVEKRKEISILKAMGASQKNILIIFLIQGAAIGGVGIALGLFLGWGVCSILQSYDLIHLPDIYYQTVVPVDMELSQFLFITIVACFITGICALYPAWRASRQNPLDGIRW